MMPVIADFYRRFSRHRTALFGAALLALIVAAAAAAPFLFPEDPWNMVAPPLLWPGQDMQFPLGSDPLGRDIAAGIFYGARMALLIGCVSTLAALAIGVTIGAVSGYYGGWLGDALMRITEVFQTMPQFVIAIVLVTIFMPSVEVIIIAIALVSWPPLARLVRAEFLSLREREFVQSCHAIGMGDVGIIFRQLLPNALAPVIVTASIMVATAILMEAGLSFLGLGDPNVMTWGTMIAAGRESLRTAWYVAAIPGIAILLTVLSLNLIGEALNDALNPRGREA